MPGKQISPAAGFLLLVLLTACATAPPQESEKYTFPELPTVQRILDYRLQSWNVIDRRSLIVQTGPSRFYLLILSQPNADLPFSENVIISSTAGSVEVGLDTVSAAKSPLIKTPIERIYELQGRAQVDEVRQQILGKGTSDDQPGKEGVSHENGK